MKIFRWLLSNVILILLVVAVIYGYMFWGNLAGDNTPAGKALAYLSSEFVEVEEFIDAIKAKQAKLSGKQKESIPESTDVAQVADAESAPVVAAEVKIESKQAPAAVSQGYNNKPAEHVFEQQTVEHRPSEQNHAATIKEPPASLATANLAASNLEAGKPVADNSAMSKSIIAKPSKGAFVTAEIERQLKNVDEQGKVIDEAINEALQQELVRNTWVAARKSFFQREYELSEKNYQKVIDDTTDNFDAYGELGNVYFNQGKKQQAASAYFEAASILVRKGEVGRARSLMGLLRQLDKVKASELQALIDSDKS
ncbi:MAG: hypothetical protein GQ549_04490 [Gammaproteobacteria bacterium]|nr:hypothetical protein [Gammaproteobacteria bacterium]